VSAPVSTKLYTCRTLQAGDAAQVRALFHEVFGQEMSAALWQWKYARDTGCATLVFDGERLVAHYGGMGRKVLWQGKETAAVQITDVMVAPSERHAVRSGSPFYLAFTGFAQHYLGYGKPYPLAYGFPNRRVMKLAELLGFYAPVGEVLELAWPAARHWSQHLYRRTMITAADFPRHEAALDQAWQQLQQGFAQHIVGSKTPAWLRWRYLEHPERQYRVVLCRARLTGAVAGVFVLRHDGDSCMLMDLLGAPGSFPTLLALAQAEAAALGCARVLTWCSAAFTDCLPTQGRTERDMGVSIPTNIWTDGPAPAELRDHWWLLPGDTDFQ
jgi:hypothetical protein